MFWCNEVDGMIVLGYCLLLIVCEIVEQCGVVVLVVNGCEFDFVLGIFSVYIDNVVVVCVVMEYLYGLGYEWIVVVGGLFDNFLYQQWLEGVWVVGKVWGCLCQLSIVLGDFFVEFGYVVVIVLLDGMFVLIVVFCFSDQMVLGVLVVCCDWGICILDEFFIVGFDDLVFLCYFILLLMIVWQLMCEIGECVVNLLFVIIEQVDVLFQQMLEFSFMLCGLMVVFRWQWR